MKEISGGHSGGGTMRDARLRLFRYYAGLYVSGEITRDDMIQFKHQRQVLRHLDPGMVIETKTVREWYDILFGVN